MSERDILLRTALVALVIAAASWFLLISPKRHEASQAQAKITAAQQKLQSASAQLSTLQQAKAQAPANARAMAQLQRALPDSAGAAALLRELNGSSDKDKVAFRTATINPGSASTSSSTSSTGAPTSALPPGASTGPDGLPIMSLTLTFDGRYLNLAKLLSKLYRSVSVHGGKVSANGRLMSVEGVDITKVNSTSARINAAVSATIYLSPPPGSATPSSGASTSGATASTGTQTTASAGAAR